MDHWEEDEQGTLWRWIGPYYVSVQTYQGKYGPFHILEIFDDLSADEVFCHVTDSLNVALSLGQDAAESLILNHLERNS